MSYVRQLACRLESAADVLEAVVAVTCFSERDLRGRDRHLTITRCRSAAMTVMRQRLSMSYSEIGRIFKRDHTSVIKAVAKCSTESREMRAIVEYLDRAEAAE